MSGNRITFLSPPGKLTLLAKTLARTFFPVLLSTGCQMEHSDRINARAIPANHVSGSFIVEFAKDTTGAEKEAKKQELDLKAKEIATEYGCDFTNAENIAWERKDYTLSFDELDRVFHIKMEGCELDSIQTRDVVDRLAQIQDLEAVEAEAVNQAVQTENDPSKSQQYYLRSINRDQACDLAGASQKPVIVAVVDSGVERNHPDLVKAFLRDTAGNVIGANFVDKSSNLPPDEAWDDLNGHGTHVAGIIAATSNNQKGIAGVAGCGNVKIMPVRVLNNEGKGPTVQVDRGVQWAIENGADIINLSLGSYATYQQTRPTHTKAIFDFAANRKVMVFAAAGNDGHLNGTKNADLMREIQKDISDEDAEKYFIYHYPATYRNVISVASTNASNEFSSFSNRGFATDIAAPGSQILSTYKGAYEVLNGTSMATPVAAGSYALALGSVKDAITENLAADVAEKLLLKSVMEAGQLDATLVTSSGVINAGELTLSVKEDAQ
ncbi:MAG: S8 family serine peptidase [Oligoflexales bacterium]